MSLRSAVFVVLLLATSAARAQAPAATAGPITHTLTGYKVVRQIPAAWTIPRFKSIAKPEPAPAGYVWYVLTGRVTNGAAEERRVNSATYRVRDAQGKEYKPDAKQILYQPEGTSVIALSVPPGGTKDWVAFFAIPADASGLELRGDDLTYAAKSVARLRIPDPGTELAETGTPAPSSQAPAAAPAPNRAAASAPRPTANQPAKGGAAPEMSAIDFYRDFNALEGAAVMKKYWDGVVVTGAVLRTINEMDGSHHVWLDANGGQYVSLSFADKGAAAKAKGFKKGHSVTARCDVGGGIGNYIMILHCELK